MAAYRLGVDVGGTFTDVVLLTEGVNVPEGTFTGEIRHTKVLTTYPNPSAGVVNGVLKALKEFSVAAEEVGAILHGTTIATNALIERRGAGTALITSRGMRDVLEIGRQIRPSLFDWFADKPEPLVPRRWRFELNERVNAKGETLAEPTEQEIRAIVERLRLEGIEAVAVSFLFSFLDATHERAVGSAIRAALPDVFVSLSSEVLPEYREYERTSTTVANAYLTPIVSRYLTKLADSLGETGLSARLHLLQSNGGVASVHRAREQAITTALSGPAGGVTAACYISSLLDLPSVISMDMGGTSCDICLIRDGLPGWTAEASVAGLPLRTPMINVEAVGAGGGSIIWVDSGGGLRVGPRSVGSDPGPVCYGRGGIVPALTDAHVVLGTIQPDSFVDKGIHLSKEAAAEALGGIAERLGMTLERTAVGAVRVINHHIAQAIRAVSVVKGHDPRDFALVAFGGAGPMHACFVAEELGMKRVVLPFAAGVFSALGAGLADFRYDYVRSVPSRVDSLDMAHVERVLEEMATSAREMLAGLPVQERRLVPSLDLRYVGQSFEINVPVGDPPLPKEPILEDFHRRHEESYGYCDRSEPVELVNVRLSAFGITARPRVGPGSAGVPPASRAFGAVAGISPGTAGLRPAAGETPALPGKVPGLPGTPPTRLIPSFDGGDPVNVPSGTFTAFAILDRATLAPGAAVVGPAIVADPNSTAIILPGWRGAVDASGTILLEKGA